MLAAADRMVKFYAPWCGHCKRMAPILDELALEAGRQDVRLGKADCTVERALCTQWNVTGYPTVFMMHRELTWRHSGARDKAGLANALARIQQPAIDAVADAAELRDALDRAGKVSFFYAGAAGEEGTAALFAGAAESLKHVIDFVASDDPAAIAAAAPGQPAPFVAKMEDGEEPLVLGGSALRRMDRKALEHWMWCAPPMRGADASAQAPLTPPTCRRYRRFPLVSLVGGANFHELSKSERLLALLIVDPCEGAKSDDDTDCVRELTSAYLDAPAAAAFREVARARDASHLYMSFNFGLMNGRRWHAFAADHHVDAMPR